MKKLTESLLVTLLLSCCCLLGCQNERQSETTPENNSGERIQDDPDKPSDNVLINYIKKPQDKAKRAKEEMERRNKLLDQSMGR